MSAMLDSEARKSNRIPTYSEPVLLSGVQALVRSAMEQRRLDRRRDLRTGVFISGYPGSPLAGVDQEVERRIREQDDPLLVHSPGLNEELAATAIGGSQLIGTLAHRRVDGVVGFWYGKNPGLDRATDAIRHANMSGTAPLGGAVAWVGDDPASKSSTLPSSCEKLTHSLGLPLLAPSTVSELLSFGLHAVALSRYAGVWSALKVVADLADASATVAPPRFEDLIPTPNGSRPFRPVVTVGPPAVAAERDLFDVRLPRALEYALRQGINGIERDSPDATFGIVAAGLSYATVLRALDLLSSKGGERAVERLRLIKLGMPWPVDPAHLKYLTRGLSEIVVVEDKQEFIEQSLKSALYSNSNAPAVYGKLGPGGSPLLPAHGALDADMVAAAIGSCLGVEYESTPPRNRIPLTVNRTPYFCSGCPHNRSTRAEDDELVGVGIGCHIMVTLDQQGRGQLAGMTQMGGEGSQWIGLAPFTSDGRFVQNLGDGTFFHSGSLAIRAAVAAGTNITYKLLYNDAVAMTGGQSAQGRTNVERLTHLLASEGVSRVVICTPHPRSYRRRHLNEIASVRDRNDLEDVMRELAEIRGVTVLIYDDKCAAEERRLRRRGELSVPKERVWINSRVCEGCGDCVAKSGCLSLTPTDTAFGPKMSVHQSSCNYDMSCTLGDCPSFVLVAPQNERQPHGRLEPPTELTDPKPRPRATRETIIRMPGIGGTGVVTVSQILQTAGQLAGLFVAGLDQTGLAQKGGSVVSDVRISTEPNSASAKATAGRADVLLAFDSLVAAEDGVLAAVDAERTVAVVSTDRTTTVAMSRDPNQRYAFDAARDRIAISTLSSLYVPAEGISERLFGDHLPANLVLLGAAYQHGCIPIGAESIEEAISLTQKATEDNLAAFRWGRAYVIDSERVESALALEPKADTPGGEDVEIPFELRDRLTSLSAGVAGTVEDRYRDLVLYQSTRYARTYVARVLKLAEAERQISLDTEIPVTHAYGEQLYRLMAYKDEYEVARLHLDSMELGRLQDEFGRGARQKYLLHPPLLRALGLDRKIKLSVGAPLAFRVLRAGRRLRGSPFDPFGRTSIRKLERSLVDEYVDLVERTVESLNGTNTDLAVRIAESADLVRGYEHVKISNVERFRTRASELVAELQGEI